MGTRVQLPGLNDDDPNDYFSRQKPLHLTDRSQKKAHDLRAEGREGRDIAIAVNMLHREHSEESRTERWYDGQSAEPVSDHVWSCSWDLKTAPDLTTSTEERDST